jgi:hypothetical protein
METLLLDSSHEPHAGNPGTRLQIGLISESGALDPRYIKT